MKKLYLFGIALVISVTFQAQTVFINEIHYENVSGDVNEGVEIAGPAGTDLTNYKVRFYNQAGNLYGSILNLSGTILDQQNGLGTLWFPYSGIQNGPSDGLVLIDNLGSVIQFLSYGGVTTAVEGEANGMTSSNIGVVETEGTCPVNFSLQLIGEGTDYGDFMWTGPIFHTRGLPNSGQTLPITKNEIEGFALYPNPVVNGNLYLTSNSSVAKQIEIYDLNGRLVNTKKVENREPIQIAHLPKGIYISKVTENGRIATRKLIVD